MKPISILYSEYGYFRERIIILTFVITLLTAFSPFARHFRSSVSDLNERTTLVRLRAEIRSEVSCPLTWARQMVPCQQEMPLTVFSRNGNILLSPIKPYRLGGYELQARCGSESSEIKFVVKKESDHEWKSLFAPVPFTCRI